MRSLNKKERELGRVVTDKSLDTKYEGQTLFPQKIEKAKQLLKNNHRFSLGKASS
jgi:predicted GNAT family N-acyltransferase